MRQTRKAPEPPYAEPETPEHWVNPFGYWLERYGEVATLSYRQQVLLAVHLARSVLHLWEEDFDDDRPRRAIEAAEAWLDDPSPENGRTACEIVWEMSTVCEEAQREAGLFAPSVSAARAAARAAEAAAYPEEATPSVLGAMSGAHSALEYDNVHASWRSFHHARPLEGVTLARDWRTPEVMNLARSIHDHHDWQGLPVLADALEEAGCTDRRILAPLRHGRDHTRASWILQQVLYGG